MSQQLALLPADQATARQLAFLNTLRQERGYELINADAWDRVTKRHASQLIDSMKALPSRLAAVAPAAAPRATGGYLADIPFAKYSVVEEGVRTFWEVKAYRGTTYIRLLVGAPGEFTRTRVGFDRAQRVAAAIKLDVLAAAQAFATHYTCCAVCGADLSDETSVALGLGPTCRRRFGL